MAAISHEHLCTIHDVDEIDGIHCLAMEFVDGQTLSDRLKTETVIPQQRAASLGAKLAQALQLAHDAGVVHRDLKPSNILLRKNGEPVITDFGLARNLFSDQSSEEASSQRALTVTGDLLGSPKYMSPEQVEADPRQVGPATDIYRLGVLLYQLVTGRVTFEGSMARVLHSIATEEPPSPRLYNPKIDSRLETILAVALAKSPKDRYASATEFASALDTFAQLPEESLGKKPGSVGNRIVLALTTTIVLAGLAAFALPRNDVSDSGDSKPGEATAGITDFRGNQSNDAEAHTDPVESESIEQSDLLRAFSSADGMIHGDFAICPLMSFEKFLLVIHPLRKAGYVPVDIRPFANHDILKVAMVWRQGEDDWHLEPQLTLEEFKKEDRRQTEAGRTIKSFVCFQPELDQRSSPVATWRFCAVWKTSDIPTRWRYHERVSPPADQHDEKDPIFAEGWRPVVMNGFVQRPTMAGLCQIWERNVPGWAFIRPTSTDVSSEDEQRVLGREVSSIFLGTWPPDILLFERWREIPGIESAVCCGESAADHLEQCRALAESGWSPVSVSATPIIRSGQTAIGSVWHRKSPPPNE